MAKSKAGSPGRVVFSIEEGEVEIVSKNERLERHGTEDVLACDLGFQWKTDNGVLACFAPALKSAIYEKPTAQGDLVDDDPGHLTHLRFPALGPLKWTQGDLEGATVTFHAATGKKGELELEGVKVNKFRLECQEGGTVIVSFRVQISPLAEAASGRLSKFFSNKLCSISVTPPQPSADLGAGVEDGGDGAGAPSRLH